MSFGVRRSLPIRRRYRWTKASCSGRRVRSSYGQRSASRRRRNRVSAITLRAYEGAPLGFELFVDHDTPKFGVREASGLYMGAVSDIRLEDGKEYVLTGVRTNDRLMIRVDENRPCEFRFSATYPLDRPLKMSVGPTLGGTGEILWAEVGAGWPRGLPRPATRHEIFGEGEVAP